MLTPRETEIAQLVADGLRNKEIARALNISEGTVKMHLHNIYGKLKISSRLQLALRIQQPVRDVIERDVAHVTDTGIRRTNGNLLR